MAAVAIAARRQRLSRHSTALRPRTQNSSSPSSAAAAPMRAPRVVRWGRAARGGGITNVWRFLRGRPRAVGEPSSLPSLPSSSSSSPSPLPPSSDPSSALLPRSSSCAQQPVGASEQCTAEGLANYALPSLLLHDHVPTSSLSISASLSSCSEGSSDSSAIVPAAPKPAQHSPAVSRAVDGGL